LLKIEILYSIPQRYLRGQNRSLYTPVKNGNKTWHRNDTIVDEVGHVRAYLLFGN